jgi:uncharacterized protein (TIGR00730 family)
VDEEQLREVKLQTILQSPSYRLAYEDIAFLEDPALRPMRVQLELLKPELAFERLNINSTIVVFGSTRVVEAGAAQEQLKRAQVRLAESPDDLARRRAVARAERIVAKARYYDEARKFAALVSSLAQQDGTREYVIVTGGGPGIMEAANRGAADVHAKSVGLNIHLPHEQFPNPYITPELCFQFRYFAMRKLHFLLRAKALVVFPGGFGTLDELFDALTLRQTGRMQEIPVVMFGRDYWTKVLDLHFLADEGAIDDADLGLIQYAETAEEAWQRIVEFHAKTGGPGSSAVGVP